MTRVRAVAEGTHHLVWKVSSADGEFALRASAASDPRARRNRERLWRTVGELGVAPVYRGSTRVQTSKWDGWIEAFDWIDGRPLKPTTDHIALAHALARLHNLPLPARTTVAPRIDFLKFVNSSLSRDLLMNKGAGPVDRLLRARTEQAIRTPRVRDTNSLAHVIVHNDLVDANVISSPDGVRLIDWDWAMISNPEIDLFCFLSPFVRSWRSKPRYISASQAAEFIGAYRRNSKRKYIVNTSGWAPYNALLANWLRRQSLAPAHAADRAFYDRSFGNVDMLSGVLASVK